MSGRTGPHMYTERFVSESVDAADLSAWRRPFKRETNTYRLAQTGKGPPAFRGAALNVGPVKYRGHHTFVVVTTPHDKTVPNVKYPPMTWGLVGVPFYRFAGICKRDCVLPLCAKAVADPSANLAAVAARCAGQRRVHHVELRDRRGHGERAVAERQSELGERYGREPGAGRLLRVSGTLHDRSSLFSSS